MNVFFILGGSLIRSKITDVYLYGNIQVSMNTLKEAAEEEADNEEKCYIFKKLTEFTVRLNILVTEFACNVFLLTEETTHPVGNTKSITHAFFPQMAPWYQLRQVLKYFFLVPMTCCSAQTLGLMRIEGQKGMRH